MSATLVGPSAITEGLSVFDPLGDSTGSYMITGHRYPVLSRVLAPAESIKGETGSLLFSGPNIEMKTSLLGGIGAAIGGELFKNSYTNKGSEPENISLAGNVPFGVIIPLNMDEHEGRVFAKRGAYFASDRSVRVGAKVLRAKSCVACCCAGMPPVGQLLKGPSGSMAFLLGSGTVVKKVLQPGEKIQISTEALVAFTDGMPVDVRSVGTLITCCFGGEGCFNTVMEGPGTVYLNSFGTEKLAKIVRSAAAAGGEGGDGGGGGAGGPSEIISDNEEEYGQSNPEIDVHKTSDGSEDGAVHQSAMER